MKHSRLILSILIVSASIFLCQNIVFHSIDNQKNKNDYAELNHVKYGFLNIDEWKIQITIIVEDEINKLYLSNKNEQVLRKHIEALLNTLIDKVDQKIREGNAGTFKGWAAQTFINAFIELDNIKKGIPEYADAVIHEVTKPVTKREIKAVLNEQLKQYSDQTFDTQDTTQLRRILLRTGTEDIKIARIKLENIISVNDRQITKETLLLIALAVILFGMSGFSKQPLLTSQYILLVLSLIILLVAGVTSPMIDMEARISQISFELMGHSVHFENQVLYFQSKSILDVFWLMVTHQSIQVKLVGLLLVTFSILFPLFKIVSSLGHFYNYRNARDNPVIRFFVLHSGKWSMADVMVVAMFMAYIGFNGIIDSQFDDLKTASKDLVIISTNATSLQSGFYLFMTYTLLALFLSGYLTRKPPSEAPVGGDQAH